MKNCDSKCMKDLEIFQKLNESEKAQVLKLARGKRGR